jgi:hypothetical protein
MLAMSLASGAIRMILVHSKVVYGCGLRISLIGSEKPNFVVRRAVLRDERWNLALNHDCVSDIAQMKCYDTDCTMVNSKL